MWILVVAKSEALESGEGALAHLREVGSRTRGVVVGAVLDGTGLDGTGLDGTGLAVDPPAAMLVDNLDSVDDARTVLAALRSYAPLKDVAVLATTPISTLARFDGQDGFDDVVVVPYAPLELYVRIRRASWRRGEFVGRDVIQIGPLAIDVAAHAVTLEGQRVEMTRQEFALLRFFCQNRGRVFSRDELLARVWGASHYGSSRTVDMHMRRLRTKIGHPALPLETVRGVGYILRAA